MLYYTKDGKQLVSTISDIGDSGISTGDKARLIVMKLIQGKDSASLRSPIPPGTKLNSVFLMGKIVVVNLSKEYIANLKGGIDAEVLAVYSIVNSLLYNIESADAVQIMVDKQNMLTAGGHIDISSPLIANMAITRGS